MRENFSDFLPPEVKTDRLEKKEKNNENKEGFIKKFMEKSRGKITMMLATLTFILGGGEVLGRDIRANAQKEFDDLDMETEKMKITENDVNTAYKRLKRHLEMAVANSEKRGKLQAVLDEILAELTAPEDKLDAIEAFEEKLKDWFKKQSTKENKEEPKEEIKTSVMKNKVESRHDELMKELYESTGGMEDFLNPNISFEKAMKGLEKAIPLGIKTIFNGFTFTRTEAGFFCEGAKITPESRSKIIEVYQNVTAKVSEEYPGVKFAP